MAITVELKTVYGNQLIYPICQQAKLFASLVNKKTLSLEDIAKIRLLGFEINVQQQAI